MATDNSPYEPSDDEARLYYYGLPSRPHLVARSSGQQWHHTLPGDSHPQIKFLRHVGKHPITDIWDARRQERIIYTLKDINWTSIDIVRIGYGNDDPVVLWIGVSPGSLNWRDGMDIVHGCVTILRKFGLLDIQCEIRESSIWRHTRPQTNVQYLSPLYEDNVAAEYKLPLTTSAGQSTGPRDSESEGTLGLYLKPGTTNSQSQKMWAITCKHVTHPGEAQLEEYQYKSGTGQPCKEMLLPGNDTYRRMEERAMRAFDAYSVSLRYDEQHMQQALPEAVDHATKNRDMAITRVNDMREFVEKILPPWKDEDNRVIGHVVYGPPLEIAKPIYSAADGYGPSRDWALVELHENKFSKPATNTVDVKIGLKYSLGDVIDMLHSHPENQQKFVMPSDGKLRIHGTVPLSELRRPTMLDQNGDPCLIVGRRGRTTGMTWGCGTGLKSVIRDVKSGAISMEFCVVHGIGKNAFLPFSEKGDSGSVVFDVVGRVVGMLIAGAGLTDRTDTTYVTPMEWLQQDLKEHGYTVEIA